MTSRVEAHANAMCIGLGQEMGQDRTTFSEIELSISCRNLGEVDVHPKPDPLCIMYTKQFGSNEWREFGRTEKIPHDPNPKFVKKFLIDYLFGESQKLKFAVYNARSKSPNLSQQEFLGSMECTLGQIVSSSTLKRALKNKQKGERRIIVSSQELRACKEKLTLKFCGKGLAKNDVFGKPSPFLLFYRTNEDGTSLIVECYDWKKDGRHNLTGSFSTTLEKLQEGPGDQNIYKCINQMKQEKMGKKYRNSGTVHLQQIEIKPSFSFLDYIKGGCQVQCTIAVDFTSSNGDPRQPTSLHYFYPDQPNQYVMALTAVGEILQDYDSDKLFPVLGFGAKLPPEDKVCHEFFLNGHPSNPYCQGVDGVLEAYQRAIQTVKLSGPTLFAPCINHVANIAKQQQDGNNYFILLIVTNGIITDMPQSTEAIVNASCLPLSIIIVGVGDADFKDMEFLDADDVPLCSDGRCAERDIVQFVPFRDFLGQGNIGISKARLARKVLEEVPEQFLSYMEKKNYKPKPPIQQPEGLYPSLQ